jgi:hypothetical protein
MHIADMKGVRLREALLATDQGAGFLARNTGSVSP